MAESRNEPAESQRTAADLPVAAAGVSPTVSPPIAPSSGRSAWQSVLAPLASITASASPYVSRFYLAGFALMLLRVVLGCCGGWRLRNDSIPVTDGAILKTIREQALRLGIRVVPMAAYCRRVSVPVVAGVLRPMILLPASLASGLTPGQLEAVLAHELAHIRRFDAALNVFQRLVEAMLFFHPLVWWLSRRVSAERENACDDLVLRSCCGRTEYAKALVRLAELCATIGQSGVLGRATLAATGKHASQFKGRVLRLLGQDGPPGDSDFNAHRRHLNARGPLPPPGTCGLAKCRAGHGGAKPGDRG